MKDKTKEIENFLIQIKGLEPWKKIYDGITNLQDRIKDSY